MFRKNRSLVIIALIVVVNALGYGIIIPILYSYTQKYGLSDFQNGLLFAVFSLCQFLATPLIGRLSDKYGRKPLLVISLAGTAISFIMMAFAPNALVIFIARALDGLTAGNLPVAQAVIADTTATKDRAKGFGIIGAAFGFGFVFGPAISAFTTVWGDSVPFVIAAIISLIAVAVTYIYLPETNQHLGEVKKGKLFDLPRLYHALFDPNVGVTLFITLLYFMGVSSFIYAFQPYSVKILQLSTNQISLTFTLFGLIGLLMQSVVVGKLTKSFGIKPVFGAALVVSSIVLAGIFMFQTVMGFIVLLSVFAAANALVQPLINTILSRETDEKSQGSMLGLNASYMSIGQILGPILAGSVATVAITYPFLAGSAIIFVCFVLSFQILHPHIHKETAFA